MASSAMGMRGSRVGPHEVQMHSMDREVLRPERVCSSRTLFLLNGSNVRSRYVACAVQVLPSRRVSGWQGLSLFTLGRPSHNFGSLQVLCKGMLYPSVAFFKTTCRCSRMEI